jgi:hypothetical protein
LQEGDSDLPLKVQVTCIVQWQLNVEPINVEPKAYLNLKPYLNLTLEGLGQVTFIVQWLLNVVPINVAPINVNLHL